MADASALTLTDGALAFDLGVDSTKVTTLKSDRNPNGLASNQLAWLINGTVRGGAITQRPGWYEIGRLTSGGWFQGGITYEQADGTSYQVCSVDGNIWRISPDGLFPTENLSAAFGLTNPAAPRKAYFCQAEQFLVIQAGDGTTPPLFWDGTTLRRSNSIPPSVGTAEIPPGFAMDYYMGRLWWAFGRNYYAGDIVRGTAGTLPYGFTDSVLKVTECPLVFGGDGFQVPTYAGAIRALRHSANIDTTTGEGKLYVFCSRAIYALSVPINRAAWISLTADGNNMPIQTVVQLADSAVNDDCIVEVNGDLFYQTAEPAIRSLVLAIRYFGQWANKPISNNERRVLAANDRSLLYAASGMLFDNRLFQTAMPKLSASGVIHQAIVPLDFDIISSFDSQNPPAWEGVGEGLQILKMFEGLYSGRSRSFAMVVSKVDGGIDLWEMTLQDRFDNAAKRVTWQFETPAYTCGNELAYKRLVGGEIWVDRLFGTVEFTIEWRPDSDNCWHPWHRWAECVPTSSSSGYPGYPAQTCGEDYRRVDFPRPPIDCAVTQGLPADVGRQFQLRVTIVGFCRVRGIFIHAEAWLRPLYFQLNCGDVESITQVTGGSGGTTGGGDSGGDDGGGGDTPVVPVVCSGAPGDLDTLDFTFDCAETEKSVTITNDQDCVLTLYFPAWSSPFAWWNTGFSKTLLPGDSATLTIRYSGASGSDASGSIVGWYQWAGSAQVAWTANANHTAQCSDTIWPPSFLFFGNETVKSAVITNPSSCTLHITGPAFGSGFFSWHNTTFPLVIAPGGSETVEVEYTGDPLADLTSDSYGTYRYNECPEFNFVMHVNHTAACTTPTITVTRLGTNICGRVHPSELFTHGYSPATNIALVIHNNSGCEVTISLHYNNNHGGPAMATWQSPTAFTVASGASHTAYFDYVKVPPNYFLQRMAVGYTFPDGTTGDCEFDVEVWN